MEIQQIQNDLSLIRDMDFIRYIPVDGDTVDFQVVGEDGHHDAHSEYDDDGCELNGSLYTIRFHGVSDLVIEGEEADSYKLISFEQDGSSLSVSYDGMNYFEPNTTLSIKFNFVSYEVIPHGHIKGADA